MAEVKWIKLCTDVFDDEKIILIDALPERDGVLVIWFKLLCMAGKQNNGGVFMLNDKIAYTDEMLATIFRRPLNTVRLALKTFEQFGMIEIINNTITISNWEKHQNLKQLEQAREQTRKRVAKHREKQKLIASGEDCNAQSNVTVTATDKKRKEEEKNRIDLEEDVVVGTTDDNDGAKRFVMFGGMFTGVMLTEEQNEKLLDLLDLDAYNYYLTKLSNSIANGGKYNGHYKTIMKWYNEDRAVAM
jgi:predicted phage replisome organizer